MLPAFERPLENDPGAPRPGGIGPSGLTLVPRNKGTRGRRRGLFAAGTLALLAAAGGGYYWTNRAAETPTIETAAVTRGDIIETVDATGTLEAVTTVQVGTQVSGTIQSLRADFNSHVTRGQLIAELDPSVFETQVEQAAATVVRLEADADRATLQLQDAQRKLTRARELAEMRLIPPTDLETAEATAQQAQAAVRSASAQIMQARAALGQSKVNLAHTRITAPIDGIVISRNVDVGQTVAASMQAPTLFVIARDLTQMRVNASIAESDIGKIQTGQRVSFRVDAYPEEIFSGQVSQVRLNPLVEQNVVSYVTVIDVPNVELKLKPGMTATVTVEVARSANVLRVPNAALRIRPSAEVFTALQQPRPESTTGGRTLPPEPGSAGRSVGTEATRATDAQVWVLVEGRLEAVPVRTGITDGTRTAVLGGGLEDGAQVVTKIELPKAATTSTSTSPLLPSRGRGAGGAGSSTRPTTTGRN